MDVNFLIGWGFWTLVNESALFLLIILGRRFGIERSPRIVAAVIVLAIAACATGIGTLALLLAYAWVLFQGWRRRPGRVSKPVERHDEAAPDVPDTSLSVAGSSFASSTSAGRRAVFMCYRRSDSADVTGRIYDRLVTRYGREHIYKDVDSIPLGRDYRKQLAELVGHCDALIAVIGRDWLRTAAAGEQRLDDARDLVRIEIATALARGIPVIPVLVGGSVMPGETDLPQDIGELAYRHGISIGPDPDFHSDVDRLIAGLDSQFRS